MGSETYQFEAVSLDDKGTSEGARDAANRLVLREQARFVLGSITNPTAGAQTVTDPNKVVLFSYAATDKSLGTAFPLTFQVGNSHNIMRIGAIYEWLTKDFPQSKRIAIANSDDAAGRSLADVSEATAKSKGLTVVAKEFYPADTKDFTPLVTRLLREKPDAVDSYAGANAPFFLSLMKALADQGFAGPAIGSSGDTKAMREGASFIKTFVAATLAEPTAATVGAMEKTLLQRAGQKYSEAEVEPYIVSAYNAPLVLSQALTAAGTVDDAAKIAKTLREGKWDTIWTKDWGKSGFLGGKTFGLPSVIEQPVYLSRVADGKVGTFSAVKGAMP